MDDAKLQTKLFGKIAARLHGKYFKERTGAKPTWEGLSAEEKRAWVGVARRAASLFGSKQFAHLVEPADEASAGEASSEEASLRGP